MRLLQSLYEELLSPGAALSRLWQWTAAERVSGDRYMAGMYMALQMRASLGCWVYTCDP